MSKDWREPFDWDEEMTPGGIKTGSEVMADLECEQDEFRDRLESHGPVFCEGYPCQGCGAYLKIKLDVCAWCGHERQAA